MRDNLPEIREGTMMNLQITLILLAVFGVTLIYPLAIAFFVRDRVQPRPVRAPSLNAHVLFVVAMYAIAGLHALAGIIVAAAPWKDGTYLEVLVPALLLAGFYIACAHAAQIVSITTRLKRSRAAS